MSLVVKKEQNKKKMTNESLKIIVPNPDYNIENWNLLLETAQKVNREKLF